MGNCVVHLMGSHASVDMLTEDRLGRALYAKLKATSTTYSALAAWEAAYVADISGETETAVISYDESIALSAKATSEWKAAEFKQSELIAYFTSLPKSLALRESVCEALQKIDFRQHIEEIKQQGRFPQAISTDSLTTMSALGSTLFSIADLSPITLKSSDAFDDVVNLFMIDLHQARHMKLKTKETQKVLEDNRGDVTRAQLFERVGSALSIEKTLYPLTTVTSQLRVGVVNYITFIEAYGSYISRALIEAKNDDTWAHVKAYLKV